MIKNLTLEQEKTLANELYYGGGVTKKYFLGGFFEGDYDRDDPNRDDMSSARKLTSFANKKTANTVTAGLGVAGVVGEEIGGDTGNVVGQAAKFAQMGMAAGPIGAGVGALIGTGLGLVQNKKRKKEQKRQEELQENKIELERFESEKKEDFKGYQEGGVVENNTLNKYSIGYTGKIEDFETYNDFMVDKIEKEKEIEKMTGDFFKYDFLKEFDNPYMDNTKTNSVPLLQTDSERLDSFVNRDRSKPTTPQMLESVTGPGIEKINYAKNFQTGGMTQGEYSHSTNPLKVVDKKGRDTGMELTGGEGVFDKPFMGKLQGLLSGGRYQEAGKAVQNEMKTWKHK